MYLSPQYPYGFCLLLFRASTSATVAASSFAETLQVSNRYCRFPYWLMCVSPTLLRSVFLQACHIIVILACSFYGLWIQVLLRSFCFAGALQGIYRLLNAFYKLSCCFSFSSRREHFHRPSFSAMIGKSWADPVVYRTSTRSSGFAYMSRLEVSALQKHMYMRANWVFVSITPAFSDLHTNPKKLPKLWQTIGTQGTNASPRTTTSRI